MTRYVMGLDGGSSKSHLALFDTEGSRIDFISWGALNHEVMDGGMAEMARELQALLALAMERNGLDLSGLACGVFGISGVDTLDQHRAIREMLVQCGISSPVLCNDAYLPIKAVSEKGYGICAINGSGCTAAGIGTDGSMLQIGGFGGLSGDMGGGSQMGELVVRTVYASLFKGGPDTLLKDLVFDRLDIARSDAFMDALTREMQREPSLLMGLNRLLFEAASAGDGVSLALLAQVGADSGRAICALLATLPFPKDEPVDVALSGSVHVRGEHPALIDALQREVLGQFPQRAIRFTVTDRPPVMGAVVWALDGYLGAREAILRVREQL